MVKSRWSLQITSRCLLVLGFSISSLTASLCSAFAADDDSLAVLTAKLRVAEIEKELVGIAPNNQPTEQRLNVIEIRLFGSPASSGDMFERLYKIEQALKHPEIVNPGGGASVGSAGVSASTNGATSTKDKEKAGSSTVDTAAAPQTSKKAESQDDDDDDDNAAPLVANAKPPLEHDIEKSSAVPLAPPMTPLSAGGMDTLPGVKKPDPKVLKSSVTANVEFKKPEVEVYKEATKLLADHKYDASLKMFEQLCQRNPRAATYFYGAGACYRQLGKPYDAFTDFVIAWHLGGTDNSMYHDVAEGMIPELKQRIDDSFKLTYGFHAGEPESVLNAGTRLWKAGFTKQAIKLYTWAIKNEPLYSQVAAYNLGVVAEYGGDYKTAKAYYDWAATQSHRLEGMVQNSKDKNIIKKSLDRVSTYYIEQARADVQQKMLKGSVRSPWFGWSQAVSLPKSWASEVCPFCAISRTSKEYEIGRSHPQP